MQAKLEGKVTFDIDECIAFAEQELTPGRFQHSLGVMQVMGELASVYALDESAARVCGILHDAAKELPLDRQLELAEKNNISLNTDYDKHPLFLHGPVGACYIAKELGVADPVVLDAILNHSYFGEGAALSPLLCWCLRFADVLEPSRDWKDIHRQLRPLVYAGNVQEGAYILMKWMIPFHESGSIPVHPNMHRVFHELSTLMDQKSLCAIETLPV
jgi:predicted HD superfamily hydrolase involved in NAD metabolism